MKLVEKLKRLVNAAGRKAQSAAVATETEALKINEAAQKKAGK